MFLSFEDGHDLPDLLALVHYCAEEGDGVAHRLCFLARPLHHRVTVRLAACSDLNQRIQHFLPFCDLMQLLNGHM